MENIKEIEKLLENWKAVKKDSELSEGIKERPFTQGAIFGLKTALKIIKKPLNKGKYNGQVLESKEIVCNCPPLCSECMTLHRHDQPCR